MTEFRTEEEQVEQLKKWWRENGTSVVLALIIGLGGYFGFNYWQDQQQAEIETASALYNQLIQVAAVNQGIEPTPAAKDTMVTLAHELKENFSGTTYADFGALFIARFAADDGHYDIAEQELKTLANGAKKEPVKFTAQARLAQVYIQQDKLAKALALVDTAPNEAFAVQFTETKGDALYRQGNTEQAIEAYRQALDAAMKLGVDTQLLQRKIDSLATAGEA